MADDSGYEVVREGEDIIVRIDFENFAVIPSIEDSPLVMSKAIDILTEITNATRIVFSQKRDYEYDFSQTILLSEIAVLFSRIVKQGIVSYSSFGADASRCMPGSYAQLQNLVFTLLKSDPVGAYVELKRMLRSEEIRLSKSVDRSCLQCQQKFVQVIKTLVLMLSQTRLIRSAEPFIEGYRVGDRGIYTRIFTATIKPDFMFTRLMAAYPDGAEELDSYTVGSTEVTIFSVPDTVQTLYHIMPPEFRLNEEKYQILDLARKVMAEHKPKRSEFTDPSRMREVFAHVGSDLIEELAGHYNVRLTEHEVEELTEILVRYTVGFGLIEVLLKDEKVQDVTVNSPMGQIPIFIVHQEFNDCKTNIMPTIPEAESWASKLRMISGRPLDEANPILDTELEIPGASSRVAVISPPLDPYGLAYAFRRHRDKPWTLPLFIKAGMLNPMAAGISSFLIDGSRTLLVAGTRSAGKSSLLGSLLIEIMRKYRIITIEDTMELPTTALRKLGYNIQAMKVSSALSRGSSEVPAADGIRTTLRMGDSCLIVGEVRSTEALALYEAMRIGALANVVAGTIHGDSPYGVFDRVVNDLKVPRTSFKATDAIIVCNPIRSADGLHRWRRMTQITEVRKHWEDDPLTEGGFVDLMKYDSRSDKLEPSKELINGDSEVLKSIASNVKDWSGNWDAVWDNIMLRSKIKEAIVKLAERSGNNDILEAPFVIQANDMFHRFCDSVKGEVGSMDSKRIFFDWNTWAEGAVKRQGLKNG